MTSPNTGHKPRPYQRHGLTALQNALRTVSDREGWLESLGEVGEALKAWKADLVADLGGAEAVSTQEPALVELAAKTYLMLVPVVLQRQQLADALARYMTTLGLKRRVKQGPDLKTYLAKRYRTDGSEEGAGHGSP